jgi:hypothetical protein
MEWRLARRSRNELVAAYNYHILALLRRTTDVSVCTFQVASLGRCNAVVLKSDERQLMLSRTSSATYRNIKTFQ